MEHCEEMTVESSMARRQGDPVKVLLFQLTSKLSAHEASAQARGALPWDHIF
jgi:hypothetical protein